MAGSKIIDQLKKTQILELLKEGKRIDGRALDEVRELTIDVGVIPKAEGSARARLGDTEVVAGVKVQPERPFPDTGDQGMLICTAEILPIAHSNVETGPPPPPVVELARVTDRGIRESSLLFLCLSLSLIQQLVEVVVQFQHLNVQWVKSLLYRSTYLDRPYQEMVFQAEL